MIHQVDTPDDPRIAAYLNVGHPDRLRASGLFVAEGRLVVRRLFEAERFPIESVLVTPAALGDLADMLRRASCPVYVAQPRVVQALTGFDFHRGCLAVARRVAGPPVERFGDAVRVLALERIGNPDNVGGLFRVAAAFGVDGIVLAPGCADPFYRKSIRTSTGAVLRVPFATAVQWPEDLHTLRGAGLQAIALTPDARATPLREFASSLTPGARLMLMLGAEGPGLTDVALAAADRLVRIPIAVDVDSLNVVVAAGIALALLAA